MYSRIVSLIKKKKEPTSWAFMDRCESETDNRPSRGSKKVAPKGKKQANLDNAHAQHRMSSDEDSDDLIPEEIRQVSRVVDFTKTERKWLSSLNIDQVLLDANLNVLINVLNFLSKKEGVYYTLRSYQPERDRERGLISSSSSNTSISSGGLAESSGNVTVGGNVNEETAKPLSSSTSRDGGGPNASPEGGVSVSPSSTGGFVLNTQTRRRDYNRIFIEPGKFYSFPESESLAMARLITEEEDPLRLFKMVDQSEVNGAFGTVCHVLYTNLPMYNNAEVALKIMDHKSERNRRNNLNEIAILRYLKHPNIVSYINSYEKNDEELLMVMEFVDGGTVRDAIKNFKFTEKYVAFVIKQVLQALEYLHSLNIAHRDLKSANIMINNKAEVKLIDFGFAIDLTLLKADTHMCGSPFWMSPEQIQDRPHSLSVDIWSLGMVVAEMMKGIVPHHKSRIKAMFLTGAVGITFNKEKKYSAHWSDSLLDFLASCLQMDPTKRPTATQLLQHPFIAGAATTQEMIDIIPLIVMSKTISKLSVKES